MDNVQSILILEDDVTFMERVWCREHQRWEFFGEQMSHFLKLLPDNWDGLMLGGQHMMPAIQMSTLGLAKCQNTQRTHCYALRGRYIRDLYQHWISSSGHCDHRMGDIQIKYNVYAPTNFLAGQSPGASDVDGNSNHELRFWSDAPASRAITWFIVPLEVMQALRSHGFHFGYSHDRHDQDMGLVQIFRSGGSHDEKILAMRRWIDMIQREAQSANAAKAAIWFPNADEKVIRDSAEHMLITVKADTLDEALEQWDRGADATDLQP